MSTRRLDLANFSSRTDWVEADLLRRLLDKEWGPGDRIASEHTLRAEYDVSRSTVRGALERLEGAGYVRSLRGSGTFALRQPSRVHGDLRVLESMTATIERHGVAATSVFAAPVLRPATEIEADMLNIEAGNDVLVTAREILAADALVAYSTELTPRVTPKMIDDMPLETSMFEFLDRIGASPTRSHTEIHAATALPDHLATTAAPDGPFLRLDQCHYDVDDNPVMWSQSFYVEGRFTFALNRTRVAPVPDASG